MKKMIIIFITTLIISPIFISPIFSQILTKEEIKFNEYHEKIKAHIKSATDLINSADYDPNFILILIEKDKPMKDFDERIDLANKTEDKALIQLDSAVFLWDKVYDHTDKMFEKMEAIIDSLNLMEMETKVSQYGETMKKQDVERKRIVALNEHIFQKYKSTELLFDDFYSLSSKLDSLWDISLNILEYKIK